MKHAEASDGGRERSVTPRLMNNQTLIFLPSKC